MATIAAKWDKWSREREDASASLSPQYSFRNGSQFVKFVKFVKFCEICEICEFREISWNLWNLWNLRNLWNFVKFVKFVKFCEICEICEFEFMKLWAAWKIVILAGTLCGIFIPKLLVSSAPENVQVTSGILARHIPARKGHQRPKTGGFRGADNLLKWWQFFKFQRFSDSQFWPIQFWES